MPRRRLPTTDIERFNALAEVLGLDVANPQRLLLQLRELRAAQGGDDDSDSDGFDRGDGGDDSSDDDTCSFFSDVDEDNQTERVTVATYRQDPPAAADVFLGDAKYGLVLATGRRRPQVPQGTILPDWVAKEAWRMPRNTETADTVKCFNGLIVHRATDAVVGYLTGHTIRRTDTMWQDCDDHSSELCDMVETLLEIPSAQLRQGFKLGTMWGDAIDAGKLGHVHQLELEPAHRGKGALADIAEPFRRFCVDRSLAAVACEVSGLHEPVLGASANAPSVRGMLKLRDSYATIGFRQVGISDWMLMVPDRAHPCWDPSTHRLPHFPYREVAKTVNDPAFVAWLVDKRVPEYLAAHACSLLGTVVETAKCATDVHAAIDAIKAHDGAALFNYVPGGENTVPAELLYSLLTFGVSSSSSSPSAQEKTAPKPLVLGVRAVKEALEAAHVHMVHRSAPFRWYLRRPVSGAGCQ